MSVVTCFGEVLWDVFPTHKKIGGAPLNVALRLNSFGVETNIISRVSQDTNGIEILEFVKNNGLDVSGIQIDKTFKTGVVQVTLNKVGSATYSIDYPVAWDKINITKKAVEKVKSSDAFIFGSLVCRDPVSKNTLNHLLQFAGFKVFDVNIRPPHYSMGLLFELMKRSDFIKCNDEELQEICEYLNFNSGSIEDQVRLISLKTKTKQICVTQGKDGATLLYNDQFYINKGYKVKVVDTVGAGDSFLATLISKLLNKTHPEKALNFACAIGSIVASKKGANPVIHADELNSFTK